MIRFTAKRAFPRTGVRRRTKLLPPDHTIIQASGYRGPLLRRSPGLNKALIDPRRGKDQDERGLVGRKPCRSNSVPLRPRVQRIPPGQTYQSGHYPALLHHLFRLADTRTGARQRRRQRCKCREATAWAFRLDRCPPSLALSGYRTSPASRVHCNRARMATLRKFHSPAHNENDAAKIEPKTRSKKAGGRFRARPPGNTDDSGRGIGSETVRG
jgi:hypothetical protein